MPLDHVLILIAWQRYLISVSWCIGFQRTRLTIAHRKEFYFCLSENMDQKQVLNLKLKHLINGRIVIACPLRRKSPF